MEIVTGAMRTLLPKLGDLLIEEYKLQKGLGNEIMSLQTELRSMQQALLKVEKVPRDEIDEQTKLWADEVRELSYVIEDAIDKFVFHEGAIEHDVKPPNRIKRLFVLVGDAIKKLKHHHLLGQQIKQIRCALTEVASRRDRNRVDLIPLKPKPIDPRARVLYSDMSGLVGIEGVKDRELIGLLSCGDNAPSGIKLKVVAVVGPGGLGKTTLVRAVYEKLKDDFDISTFVTIGQHFDMKQAVRDILKDVAPGESDTMTSELWKLVTLLKVSLEDKRYLIVVDDVWDKDFWQTISSAFLSSNCHGSRIIITTRNYDVAHAFCPSPNDVIHRMKYLTDIESEALFCQRVFPEGSGCPPELRSLAVEILKKCAGVPLAIVTLSSLLASEQIQPAHKWHALLGSIGRGLVDRSSSEEMRKILLLSYDDLPVELRTFLLYMSLFPPELFSQTDFVWKMVAEGFVQPEKQRTCSEVAASYFNEIVNRNLVNARCRNIFGEVVACELHGILLEILRSLSKELNFTHVLDSTDDIMPPGRLVRRLSISYNQDQFGAQEHINSIEMSQVRSLMISPPSACVLDLSGLLSRCKILRVLDLSGCSLSNIDLKVVCNLIYLRYLNLSDTDVSQLPEDIGRLQLLQYLSVSYCRALEVFPSSIRHLRRLMYLSSINTCLLDGLGNLLDLEVLCSRGLSVSSAEDLRNLSNLRYLQIHFENQSLEFESSIVVSVSKLLNIQDVNFHGQFHSLDLLAEKWAAHKNLRSFDTFHSGPFSQLPAFLKKDPLQFSMLLQLSLLVKELVQEDISVLGRLPALVSLKVESTTQVEPVLSVDADGFKCLIHLDLCCKSKAQIFFCEGALRKVKELHISIGMRAVNKMVMVIAR